MLTAIDTRRFQRIIVVLIVLPLLLMLLLIGGLLAQTQIILTATGWVSHTDTVIRQASTVQRLLIDMETGVRGYLLTSNTTFLEPYTRAQSQTDQTLNTLTQLVQDNPHQLQQLSEIRASFQEWHTTAQQLLTLHDSNEAQQALDLNLRGKQQMDILRSQLEAFIATEVELRDTRIQAFQNTMQTIIIISIVLLISLGAALAVIGRHQVFNVARIYQNTLTLVETQAARLQASEERFRVTLASLGDAVIATDTKGQVTFLNAEAEALTGWPAAEAVGQDILSIFPIINEYTRQPVENPIVRTIREGRIVGLANHTLLLSRDGSECPIDDSSAPIYDGHGALIGAVLIFRDIREKHQAEQALRQSEERLRLALRNSPITVYSQDTDLRYTWLYNPAPGYDASDTIGKFDTDIAAPEDAARLMALKQQVIDSGKGIHEQIRVRGITGELYFDLSIEPLRDAQGTIIGVTGAAHDITAQKHAEEERIQLLAREQAARAEAQEAVRIRDMFFSVAAHELKTPLTSLFGNIQLIQRRVAREGILSARDQRAFAVIGAQTQRLNRMVEALLDVTRMEAGQLSLEAAPLDLCQLVEQIVVEVEPTLINHTITHTTPEYPLIIIGDGLRLEQVLQNLIQNAVKYSPTGGTVQIMIQQEEHMARVDVVDQGIGIPIDAQAQLFTRFYRASDVDTKQIRGLGIGLYVVKEIVTLHGGTVVVSSQEGLGSMFTMRLPLVISA